LQLNLLSEQKIAKLIDWLKNYAAISNVKDRYDSEAGAQTTDPHTLVNTLEKRLEEELVELQRQEQSSEPPKRV